MNILSFFKLQFILWVLPLAIIIQNIEMASGLYSWLTLHEALIPAQVKVFIGDIYANNFKDRLNTALFIASILPLLVVSFFNRTDPKSFTRYILTFTGFTIIIGAFGFMIITLATQSYFPGGVSAMFMCLPLCYRLVKYCFETFQFPYWQKILVFLLSIILYFPLTVIIWMLSSLISY